MFLSGGEENCSAEGQQELQVKMGLYALAQRYFHGKGEVCSREPKYFHGGRREVSDGGLWSTSAGEPPERWLVLIMYFIAT